METTTITVTVAGDRDTIEVDAEASVAVGDLLPSWAARCSSSPPADLMVLSAEGGSLLDPSDTLAESGLGYGALLRLVTDTEVMAVLGAKAAPWGEAVAPAAPPSAVGHDSLRDDLQFLRDRPAAPASADAAGWSVPGGKQDDLRQHHPTPSSPPPPPPRPTAHAAPDPDRLPATVARGARLGRAVRALLFRKAIEAPPPATFLKAATPSAGERYRLALQEADRAHNLEVLIRQARLKGSTVIAVISPKGGPGKTTITALLGTLLAEFRRDPVIALDANPDFGDLKDKLSYEDADSALVDSLAEWLQANPRATPSEFSRQLGIGPHGLRFVATPRPPEGEVVFEPTVLKRMILAADYDLYASLIRRLRDYAGVLLVDCGTGLLDPPVRAALEAADQIVLVTDSAATTARQVVASARLLPTNTPTWLVANKMAKSSRLDLPQVVASIPQLKGVTVVPVPAGELAENIVTPNFRWEGAPQVWQEPLREIAARLANYWPKLG